jgi:CheY-like chemotaxis protein
VRLSSDQLLAVINDILDFSKIEAGHLQLEAITFAPASTFRTVVELLRPRAQAKSLTLVVDFDPQLPAAVVGDPTRLRQVLLNLLGNAIKFTDRGTVTLRVSRVASPQADAPAIQFTVRDTGIGMDAASVGRLFTPFTQADSSMSRRFGGTGLGLAISQKLVEAMNGKISARSEPGRGSEFTFTLRFQQPGADEAARVRYTNRDRFTPPSFQGRILVVEDDRINQRVVIHFLKQMGLTVTLAEDGLDAVKAATSGNCDLVLMDCQLPGIDGIEATRRIRENLAGRRLPIIALTANASTQDRAACFSAGMDDFIAKPVRAEQLAAMFEKWLPPSPGRN